MKHRVADVRNYAGLGTPLEEALVSREFLTSLLGLGEVGGDDEQIADIKYRIAEIEGVIAALTDITKKH